MGEREKYLGVFAEAAGLLTENAELLEQSAMSMVGQAAQAVKDGLHGYATSSSMCAAHMWSAADACRRAAELAGSARKFQHGCDEDGKARAARHN